MHMSLRGITLLKTSVFRFLFYPQSELIFVLLTSPLASPWRLPQGRFWFSILSFCCCEQAEIRAEFLNTSEAADAKRIPRVEVMCCFFIGNCMAWCLWWVQWDFKDIISIAQKCQKYKTVEIVKMISTVVHGAAVLSPRLLFLLFLNGLQPAQVRMVSKAFGLLSLLKLTIWIGIPCIPQRRSNIKTHHRIPLWSTSCLRKNSLLALRKMASKLFEAWVWSAARGGADLRNSSVAPWTVKEWLPHYTGLI